MEIFVFKSDISQFSKRYYIIVASMRILLVSQYYYPERFSVTDIAEGLAKLGHKVSVLTGKPNYGLGKILDEYKKTKYEVRNGVEIYRVNLYPRKHSRMSIIRNYLSFHRNAKRFVSHFKQEFDIVISVSLSPVISIAPAIKFAKKNNIPHLLICEDLWPESTVVTKAVRKNSLMYKVLYKWSVSLYNKCDEIAISSPSFKEYFNDVLHISDKKFPLINQPILLSNSKGIEPVEYKDKFNVVYAGNIGKLQLIDKLVEAMKLLKGEGIKLHLMGMGSELPQIQKQIEEENLSDLVVYEGALPIEKAESYYVNADALIVSLKNEGYVGKTIPNKAIQYLKYKKPLVGVIQGDAKELLEKADGTLFASEEPEDIARAIKEIVHLDDKKKAKMGENNLDYFNNNLSVEQIVKNIEKELSSLIKK